MMLHVSIIVTCNICIKRGFRLCCPASTVNVRLLATTAKCKLANMPKNQQLKEADKPLRERILDAVESCFARYGIQKTTLADIAEEVGVSRMTVYRQFKDRQALFNGAVLRNLNRHWQEIGKALSHCKTLESWLMEAVLYYRREFTTDETVKLYGKLGAYDEGIRVALSDAGLLCVIEQFSALYEEAQDAGRLAPGATVENIAEWVHRTNHTLIVHPSPRLDDETTLRNWLSAQICGGFIAR